MTPYEIPSRWMRYDENVLAENLSAAHAAILAIERMPFQRGWIDRLQAEELQHEVAGTVRMEGGDLTEAELTEALHETPGPLQTRIQRQAHAAAATYRWIATIPDERPIDGELILEIHSKIITGADDDLCEPGVLRQEGQEVTFGEGQHQGALGGKGCTVTFSAFARALRREFRGHNEIVRALAAQYHLSAIHPFPDGNGRTARALEALLLKRAGFRGASFIAMSGYYHDEKANYLKTLGSARRAGHDLTGFLEFGLRGVVHQAERLLGNMTAEVRKVIYRDLVYDLFHRVKTNRQQAIAKRQTEILMLLLDSERMTLSQLSRITYHHYKDLKAPRTGLARDLSALLDLGSIDYREDPDGDVSLWVRPAWPAEASVAEYFQRLKAIPSGRTYTFFT